MKQCANDAIKLFDEAFPQKSLWNELHFNNSEIAKAESRFVAWIDVMGSRHVMVNAMRNAACFVGVLHEAIMMAKQGFGMIGVHSMTDGAYVIGEQFNDVARFVTCVMRSCARYFAEQDSPQNRFLVRSAISYGKVFRPSDMEKGFGDKKIDDGKYKWNIMLGLPFVRAEQGEHLAPPFGIYIDESVRTQTDSVSWVLHRWWNPDRICERKFAACLGNMINEHLELMGKRPISMFAPKKEKLDCYRASVSEYFETY